MMTATTTVIKVPRAGRFVAATLIFVGFAAYTWFATGMWLYAMGWLASGLVTLHYMFSVKGLEGHLRDTAMTVKELMRFHLYFHNWIVKLEKSFDIEKDIRLVTTAFDAIRKDSDQILKACDKAGLKYKDKIGQVEQIKSKLARVKELKKDDS